ncbi:hypothetical protein [Shewanella sp. SR44-3]|uniref:hypothetical protein n=1 Tax=Shewanella sp. SR44-3 TaxID=2760936 RepID=UPI0015FD83F9|nr:hypothetical protein [Shewanella sp. SR44-3]MBB1268518.1 hypothetical protein [Shewanella sp. SR44-3]
MKLNLLRHVFILFTLLSLLGQGVMANGYSIMPTQAENMSVAMDSSQSSAPMLMQAEMKCHDSALNMSEPSPPSCCDGPHKCNLDCNHCLSLAMAATLFTTNIKVPKIAPQTSLGFVRHDFTSQAPAPAFRPPII